MDKIRNSIPYVIEQTNNGERVYDVYSRLLKDRIVFIGTEIDDFVSNSVIAQLLFLSNEDANSEINIYINSPGGSVSSGLAIYDTMNFIKPEIKTYCVGMAASMAAILMSAGTKGKRYALPNSRIMIHQPMGGFRGQASDIDIQAKEILKMKETLNQILSENTKQPIEKIRHDTDRDYFLSAEESKEYGLVDEIIKRPD
jgi:ATP-dependent Clp protease protease subunit